MHKPSASSIVLHPIRWFLLLVVLLGLSSAVVMTALAQPHVFAGEDPTPTPIPGLNRQAIFRGALRPDFQDDILLFPHAPLYRGAFEIVFEDDAAVLLVQRGGNAAPVKLAMVGQRRSIGKVSPGRG